jgi:hypothetical protein
MLSARERFEAKLHQKIQNGTGRQLFTEESLRATISRWNEIQTGLSKKKTPHDYKIMQRYAVVEVGNESVLIKRQPEGEEDVDNIERFFSLESMFDRLMALHNETGHGRRDRLIHRVKECKFANITRDIIEDFLNLCQECQKQKPFLTKGITVKPLISEKFGQRFQAGNNSIEVIYCKVQKIP